MNPRTTLTFLLSFFLTLPTASAPWPLPSPSGATVSPPPDESDSLVLPDGTPLRVKVLNRFSSADAKVGDLIHFAVGYEVRADGVVVIPQRTEVTAKVVFVSPRAVEPEMPG